MAPILILHDGLRDRTVVPFIEHGSQFIRSAVVMVVIYNPRQRASGRHRPSMVDATIVAARICTDRSGYVCGHQEVVLVADFDVPNGPWVLSTICTHASVRAVWRTK
ncbi:uncharacterized protein ATNIH1004_002078 [Aspergillus tanneri]|uniref:Uncharacterized protein n=1 Tax=Aspergillus tanneri TaxID=1220188 RepID=A0A5M9ME53_9EURO|nr:uncharacterized protein ATNIH1004_002078 [Aspergillus tanneri]KAA8641277.1 hypothetical protein ATNIH1004_002078 [Aspergillus tanneri]